jgi:excisionase family DNA binding protein
VSRGFPNRPASIKAAATHGGVSTDTIRRRIASGELRAWRHGTKLIRVDLDDVEQLFRQVPTVERAS